ncbi:unnamed protein product [Didymodactylos carnosus]|uniref:Uncharacterized protein n=1 Tax=Didymodactylos carnosus TaxID=1234261 RepID=A0A8S2CPR7_9BILA|nr:unnamed protein product [Didymodactylos carnosus]CAF3552914.1 unnamed protein product [Didymodactylos carnosus]
MFVWRGYNGHVYFEPIKCTRLENERETASVNMNDTPLEIDKNSKRRSLAHNIHTHQQQIKRSHSTLSPQKQKTTVGTRSNMSTHDVPLTIKKEKVLISNQSTTTYYEHQRRQNLNSQFSNHSLPNDVCVGVDETLSIIESSSKLNNNTLETFIQEELNESMWQSVKSCAPTKTKPTSKRSKHLIEDAQNTQQEQSIQDSTVYHRQVLPNIKAIPKYKNVYKGLAYKEGKKLSNNNFENDASKPLVSYNLAPAYTSFETNVYKDKSQQQQNSLSSPSKEQPTTAVYDIKEIRKRIIKGTTLPYRPSHSTSNRIRGDGVGSETSTSVSGVKVKGKLIAKTPLLNDYGFLQSSHTSINMTTPDSNHKQLSLTDVANITSPLKTKTPRAHKNNSVTNRSRTHHTTPIHSQQQSSVFSLTPRFNTVGETTIVF